MATPAPSAGPAAWHQLEADSPAAREDHTWTVDSAGSAAWLFGGRDGQQAFDDLWRFDLATDEWQSVDAGDSGPAARFGHTATWVDGVGLVVWSGQGGPTTFFDDLWTFDPTAAEWRELSAPDARPASRYGSCASLGPDGRLWVSHGFTADAGRFADTWAYDFEMEGWTDATPTGDLPVARCLHDCLWTPDGRLVLYAGQTTGVAAIGDLWSRSADGAWEKSAEEGPAARQLYALATAGTSAWVFGGGAVDGAKLDDLWTLNLETLRWSEVTPEGSAPGGRSGATLVSDPDRGRLLLFGGLEDDGARDDTWELTPAG